jgi:uncharacterized protein YdcH (DUF465 family)
METTMVASHDLCQDLGISREDFSQRRASNAKLDKLADEYDAIDQRTVDAEVKNPNTVPDSELNALKEERLLIKDKIKQQLIQPAAKD